MLPTKVMEVVNHLVGGQCFLTAPTDTTNSKSFADFDVSHPVTSEIAIADNGDSGGKRR